jgi:hydroxymethylpyrimidine/phosphomethylpyrimidine kinase
MIAKGGAKLIDNNAVKLLKNELIKKVSLITPNIPEAEMLTNTIIKTKEDMIFAASILINLGAKNVFIKGGHLDSREVQDIFVNKKEIVIIKNKRITTSNTHGTGCTLSSAISTFFACGKTLKKSCELATKYVNNSIRSNLNYGKGHGPINHLSSITVNKKFK